MNRNSLKYGVAAGVLLIVAALALKYAERYFAVGPDVSTRTWQMFIGLVLAFYANTMPKTLPRSPDSAGRWQSALRLGGWAFVLAGLGYTAVWAFAPAAIAAPVSMAMVASAMVFTFVYASWVCMAKRRSIQ